MGKSNLTLSIDSEVVNSIRNLSINTSKEVNNFLKLLIKQRTGDIDGLNLQKLEEEYKELETRMLEKKLKLDNLSTEIEIIKKRQEQKKIKDYEEQKKRIEDLKKCYICGEAILDNEKKAKLENGRYIHSDLSTRECYRTALFEKKLQFIK